MGFRGRVTRTSRRLYVQVLRGRERVKVVRISEPSDPLGQCFILGVQRSGTTPLRLSLDSHPLLAAPPESQFLLPLVRALDDGLVASGLEGLGYDQAARESEFSQFAVRLFEGYCAAVKPGASFWVDKTPQYVPIASRLVELFPEARFVFITRAPIPQIESFTKGGRLRPPPLQGHEGSVLQAASEFWAEGQRQLAEGLRASGERGLAISYEELCAAPQEVLARVCRHLGVPPDETMIDYGRHRHQTGLEGTKAMEFMRIEPVERRVPSWYDGDDPQLSACLEVAEAVGYPSPLGDREPVDLTARLLRLACPG
jgi:protein-tyrosine sulfotransferase